MIKLEKGNEPQVLVDNAAAWTADLLAAYQAGHKPTEAQSTRYRHEDVKAAIIEETGGKCAYCETKVIHNQPGDIEHLFPKSLDRAKTFEWANLTLACRTCNANKSNKDPFLNLIIDPYVIDPQAHIVFLGPFIFSTGTATGTSTRELLELHRAALTEDRRNVLERHMLIYDQMKRTDLPLIVRQSIYDEFVGRETSNSAEYAAMNRSMIAAMREHLPADMQ